MVARLGAWGGGRSGVTMLRSVWVADVVWAECGRVQLAA